MRCYELSSKVPREGKGQAKYVYRIWHMKRVEYKPLCRVAIQRSREKENKKIYTGGTNSHVFYIYSTHAEEI